MTEIRAIRNPRELANVFDLLGAQFPDPLDTSDRRFDDLAARFPADQRLMLVACADEDPVGGALAFRHGDGTVTLRIMGVVEAFRQRGMARRLVERVHAEARLLGAHSVGVGTGEEVGFWYHLGYTPNLLFQWVYDPELYEPESEALLSGPLSGLRFRRSSFNDVAQLFVELEEPRLDLHQTARDAVAGCDVGFMMSKTLADERVAP